MWGRYMDEDDVGWEALTVPVVGQRMPVNK